MTDAPDDVYIYPESTEFPQPLGSEQHWQESFLIHWWDQKNGIGGMHRLAREPYRDGGRAVLFFGVVTRAGLRFNRYRNIPLTSEHIFAEGIQIDSYRMTFNDHPRFVVNDDGCEMDLHFEDTMPRVDLSAKPTDKTFMVLSPSHFEVAGRVRGKVKLRDKQYDIDGVCVRDHSWGIRDWEQLIGHRWIAGWFGTEISFALGSVMLANGGLTAFGLISRNGQVSYARNVDLFTRTETDGQSHRGGLIVLTMANGEKLEIDAYRRIEGISFMHNGLTFVQELCDARFEGREGQCTFEVTARQSDATHFAKVLIGASTAQGWSQR